MTQTKEKPYYLRQPWDILFKENKLEKNIRTDIYQAELFNKEFALPLIVVIS